MIIRWEADGSKAHILGVVAHASSLASLQLSYFLGQEAKKKHSGDPQEVRESTTSTAPGRSIPTRELFDELLGAGFGEHCASGCGYLVEIVRLYSDAFPKSQTPKRRLFNYQNILS